MCDDESGDSGDSNYYEWCGYMIRDRLNRPKILLFVDVEARLVVRLIKKQFSSGFHFAP